MKIDDGVGYRVYFAFSGTHIVLLLFGGAKPKQNADIVAAKKLWAEIQSNQD
ncbi:MAG TPA: addiction module killer protein [Blastocatellia bacterium]|nr:addiction module killer protein [Blastocatellia bacterium]HMV87656.1 addiction module killer protein [Blastocatellia bacterium]HMX24064.1 addiction module killer protein [Blastocatellia bacterium]HMY70798.1 addiction module killer protein [Blastocatellia bacterium]HMZ17472.1 addiction module killer protein [Blastocatellia bacterium]